MLDAQYCSTIAAEEAYSYYYYFFFLLDILSHPVCVYCTLYYSVVRLSIFFFKSKTCDMIRLQMLGNAADGDEYEHDAL